MPKILTQEKIAEVRHNFEFFDRDSNGYIDQEEFAELLTVIEPRAREEEIEKGFREVDSDGDGSIDYSEFMAWWNQVWWQF